jgi:hypothetical protein
MGRATKGTWDNLGRQTEKEMIIHNWISSDGSELVPTTEVKNKPYLTKVSCPLTKLGKCTICMAFRRKYPWKRGGEQGRRLSMEDDGYQSTSFIIDQVDDEATVLRSIAIRLHSL